MSVWQLGDPNVSPAPYMVKEDLYVSPVEDNAVLITAGEVPVLLAGAATATVGTLEALTTGAAGADDAGALATGAAADERAIEMHVVAGAAAATVGTSLTTGVAGAEAAGTLATGGAADEET